MRDSLQLNEIPKADTIHMIAGWRQWADGGSISSGLPRYLVEEMGARKIGEIGADGYYLFQIPGMHHLLRPVIKLEDGYRQELELHKNEIYYAGTDEQGLVIFLGDEPHLNVDAYAADFISLVKELQVQRIVSLGGVFGPTPYDRDRHISCIYSLPEMKVELDEYALNFSNYEGGSSIGSYLLDQAEKERVEFVGLYGFVPAYDFGQSLRSPQGFSVENDFKSWYDIMRRVNHMLGLNFDLSDLARRSEELLNALDDKIAEMERENPQLKVREYMARLDSEFTELSFMPLADIWDEGLRGLLDDLE